MKRLIALGATVAIAAGAGAASIGSPATAVPLPSVTQLIFNDPELECLSLTPDAVSVPVVDDPGDPITLDLHVIADRGVSDARARSIVAQAQRTYTPLNINLNVVSSEHVNFTGTDALGLIGQAKARVGGPRPAGTDVVITITSADLTVEGLGNGVAGMADCIGGVNDPAHSFLVAEDAAITVDYPDQGFDIGPVTFSPGLSAKIVGHELGHILGAHHHYGNCAEGVTAATDGDYAPCTIMLTVVVDFLSHRFGALESNVVRAHAHEWAR